MNYLYDEEYKSEFKKLINEFKNFKKNIIIKEKRKSIEGFKVVNSNKCNKKTLYLENLEITFENYYYYFDIKSFFEKFNNYKNVYKFKVKKEIKKYKKLNKNKLDEKLNLLISKKNELHLIKNKNNTLFYDSIKKRILDFDINFNELKIDKDNLELMLKQITDININYEIDYYRNGPFDVIYHYAEENLFFNVEKINKKFYIYTYKGKKYYCLEGNNILVLYDEKEKIKTIEINQEENRNNIFNFINYKDIVEIKNNTNINIKKIDNPYNFKKKDNEVIIYDGINKQFDIIYENYDLNLIGIILDSEFFILKRNSELLKGKNINVIYKKLINNRYLLEKENSKCNMIFNF